MAEAQDRAERESALERTRLEREAVSQNRLGTIDTYRALGSRKFEDAIAEVFRRAGYQVHQTPYSRDGGKDAILWKGDKKYLLECKCYREEGLTGRRDLQILFAAMREARATEAFFVTTGSFTSTAVQYAKMSRIELYDKDTLPDLLRELEASSQEDLKFVGGFSQRSGPTCPKCSSRMRIRLGPRGKFWGCSDYPSCSGVRRFP